MGMSESVYGSSRIVNPVSASMALGGASTPLDGREDGRLDRSSVLVSRPGLDPERMGVPLSHGDRLPVKRHLAYWSKLGPAAGPERNGRVVADCDRLVAFWDGLSRGTDNAIKQAEAAGKPVDVRRFSR